MSGDPDAIRGAGRAAAESREKEVSLLRSCGAGENLLRRALPLALVVPSVLAALRVAGERAGFYGSGGGTALLVISLTAFLAAMVWQAARELERMSAGQSRATAALRESEERLNLALKSSGVGTWSWNVPANTIIWDDYIHPLFGLKPGTFPGRYEDFLALVHAEDRERVGRDVAATVERDEPYDNEYRVVWPGDGTVHVLASRGKVYRAGDGRPLRMTGVCWDQTARRNAEDEVRRLAAELELRVSQRTAELQAANRELESFSYSVSHDLRAPLRAIDGFSRILLEDFAPDLPPEAQRAIHVLSDNTRQMGCLIDDLLAFSRLGRKELQKRKLSPATIVREALEVLDGERNGRKVDVSVGDLAPCEADPNLLKQVWVNLLSNALKYTRPRERAVIEVGSEPGEDGHAVYYVRDNGVGFDMKYAGKLFGVFQRLHRSDEYEGTGVGLAIVQRVISRHGGRVWAQAEPDRGATFYFTLNGGAAT